MIWRPEAKGARRPSASIKHSLNANIAARSYRARRPALAAAVGGAITHCPGPDSRGSELEKLIRSAERPSMSPLDKFEISIRRKDDKIIAAAPQLGLYATATDIHGAIDALERKKAALLEDLTAAGEIEHLSPVAAADPVAPAASQGLAQFTVKVGIVVVLIAVAIVIATNLIATKLETTRVAWQATLQDYSKIGGAQFWSKVEKSLDQLADPKSEMPE